MSSFVLIIIITLGLIFTLTPAVLAFVFTKQKFYFNLIMILATLWTVGLFIFWIFITDGVSKLNNLSLKGVLFLATILVIGMSIKIASQHLNHKLYNRNKRQ